MTRYFRQYIAMFILERFVARCKLPRFILSSNIGCLSFCCTNIAAGRGVFHLCKKGIGFNRDSAHGTSFWMISLLYFLAIFQGQGMD
ncbi:uncharacterized protein EV420DRAFT_1580471 [Desarmillaria tabescens]|uniref:Uncharacterized protein n=1 Tax=Armillaria tabescens TaxID=1929756 RepID=A0AA39JH65_ARMTA|nr:uncharacterized protein EV420DRAFT_1580471 [Desarmillaria tabescens]KAK0441249.1 hypothetical protein EV420DRAFT_1580471 [Desarmillaria tabescens]